MSDQLLAEVLRAVNDLGGELRTHITDETDDLKQMRKASEERGRVADDRHAELVALIHSINIVEALPKYDGKPDVHGHRNDHETRMKAGEAWRKRYETIITAVIGSISIGVIAWIGSVVWRAFLMGPKP